MKIIKYLGGQNISYWLLFSIIYILNKSFTFTKLDLFLYNLYSVIKE